MTILETLIKLRDDLKLWATNNLKTKADKATTLAGYGITDAYTKLEVESQITDLQMDLRDGLNSKANVATTLAGYGIADAYTKTHVDTAIAQKSQVQIITWEADD